MINEIGKAQILVNIWWVSVMAAFGTMLLRTWFDSRPTIIWRIAQLVERWLLTDRLQVQVLLAYHFIIIGV